MATTNGSEIDTYAEADTPYLITVTIQGFVYENGALIDSQTGSPGESPSVSLNDSINQVPATYESLVSVSACEDDDDDGEGNCGGDDATVSISATDPNVTAISPSTVTIGSSGTLTLTGTNLIDQFGNSPVPVNDPGVALTITSISDTQATVSYTATGGPGGPVSIGLNGLFGEGTQQTITVLDQTPTVSSVSPSSWNSGTTTAITIYGSGFGTHPSVSIAGPGVTAFSVTGVSDTQINATVTVAPLVAAQTATVQVQSNGYTTSGFLGSPGQSSQGLTTASLIQSVPTPQILFFGSPINGPISMTAGQEVSLSIQSPPVRLTVVSGTFSSNNFGSFNIPVAIDGWAPSTSPTNSPTYTTNTNSIPTGTTASPPFTFLLDNWRHIHRDLHVDGTGHRIWRIARLLERDV